MTSKRIVLVFFNAAFANPSLKAKTRISIEEISHGQDSTLLFSDTAAIIEEMIPTVLITQQLWNLSPSCTAATVNYLNQLDLVIMYFFVIHLS